MKLTHVTEIGLGSVMGMDAMRMAAHGLRPMTVACTGLAISDLGWGRCVFAGGDIIPTCPRCAVLRDEALEGRLPKRGAA